MDKAETKKRMLANWEKAGKPVCRVCTQPTYGITNMRYWKTNGNLCPFCFMDALRGETSKYYGEPPLGIRHEE